MLSSFCQDIYQMLCRKFPNRNIYIIGDHHFYHQNILNYSRFQFSTVEEMNDYIIKCHNEVVGNDDIVIFLGDFCFKKAQIKDILSQMNGHKYLVLGNHDSKDIIKNYPLLGFEAVFTFPVRLNDIYLSHEPLIKGEKDSVQFNLIVEEFKKAVNSTNYHGHIHSLKFESKNPYQNVTCEFTDYQPILVGKTKELVESLEKPLFINSDYFSTILKKLQEKHGIDPKFLIADYIYSYMLEALNLWSDKFYVQGSFGLFKKYGFISRFSDLDISAFFNPKESKRQNDRELKALVEEVYSNLLNIEKINLEFVKRYCSIRILETLYTSDNPYFVRCFLDANLIDLDCYREKDFQMLKKQSFIQKLLSSDNPSLLEDFNFPNFSANFLTPEGDIANLILQMLFQQKYEEKKVLILRKLNYVFKQKFKNHEMTDFSDTLTRFFLRNVAFLNTLHRYDEIEFLQGAMKYASDMMSAFSVGLQNQVASILLDPSSDFMKVYNEISSVSAADTFKACEDITRQLKKDK